MRDFIDIVEGRNSRRYGRSVLYRGFYFKKMDEYGGETHPQERYLVMLPDGRPVGNFIIDKYSRANQGYWSIHSNVRPEYQRKGIGTIMYDFAEELAKKAGTQIMPSSYLSSAAHKFWTKRDPERLQMVKSQVLRHPDDSDS